ncbi:Centrosomal protein of 72 kDa [Galemys pyrenaicus]|uniref:Centrosomal protein of 72 kDa n=1 Tax=Galemys pyrenaicus TaxID=202257 RepID=A0A8J6DL40_GALPY|nr:Centrosomal protein of 72 kDa [Galemys pyrenaicus]
MPGDPHIHAWGTPPPILWRRARTSLPFENMAPASPRLVLCEEKIREKSGLAPHRDLGARRRESGRGRPGYRHRAAQFRRRALSPAGGIQYLVALQSLNLYYNCISSLEEVLRLRSLVELSDVDLRLNPVVQCEPDCRLLVLHLLPQLKRLGVRTSSVYESRVTVEGALAIRPVPVVLGKRIPLALGAAEYLGGWVPIPARVYIHAGPHGLSSPDDRPVRDSERKASWLHFASEDSLDSLDSPAFFRVGRPRLSKASRTDPTARKCLALDADDEAVLNLIAECEWGLSNPPGSTGSSQKEHEVDVHGPQGPRDSEDSGTSSQRLSLSVQKLLNSLPAPEKYRKRRTPGGRVQAPVEQESLSCLEVPTRPACPEEGLSRQSSSEGQLEQTFPPSEASEPGEPRAPSWGSARQASPRLPTALVPGRKAALELAQLEALLDLVDRYWSGHRSLHGHGAFLAQARRILSSVEEFTSSPDSSTVVREEVNYLTLENKSLKSHLAEQQQQHSAKMREVVSALSSAHKEMDDLKQHLDKSLEENSSLKSLLSSMEQEVRNTDASAALNLQISATAPSLSGAQASGYGTDTNRPRPQPPGSEAFVDAFLSGLQTSVKKLSGEIVELKEHLEHCNKIRELTHMLQESHSSLVSTNERLLQELSQLRVQHQAEVEQLHWSYRQLKKTLALAPQGSPPGSASLGGRS